MMAGLVDTSVHIQDPGRGDWEGFAAATKAAGRYFYQCESSYRINRLEKFDLQST